EVDMRVVLHRPALASRLIVTSSLVLATACTGGIGDPPAGPRGTDRPIEPEMPVACDLGVPQVAPAPLRRLTPEQYRNTLRDLLGDAELTPAVDDAAPI